MPRGDSPTPPAWVPAAPSGTLKAQESSRHAGPSNPAVPKPVAREPFPSIIPMNTPENPCPSEPHLGNAAVIQTPVSTNKKTGSRRISVHPPPRSPSAGGGWRRGHGCSLPRAQQAEHMLAQYQGALLLGSCSRVTPARAPPARGCPPCDLGQLCGSWPPPSGLGNGHEVMGRCPPRRRALATDRPLLRLGPPCPSLTLASWFPACGWRPLGLSGPWRRRLVPRSRLSDPGVHGSLPGHELETPHNTR